MNASRPEAEAEYSTRPEPLRAFRASLASVLGLALAGAIALVVAEFEPVLRIVTAGPDPVVVRTVRAGPHHGWALLPIAALALLLIAVLPRVPGRAALLALALLGVAALAVALVVDLPSVHSTGLVGSPTRGLHTAQAHAGVGLYVETAGAAALIVAGAAGLLLL